MSKSSHRFDLLKDQSGHHAAKQAWSKAMRNRGSNRFNTIEQATTALGLDQSNANDIQQTAKWFSGWEIPDAENFNKMMRCMGLWSIEAIEERQKAEAEPQTRTSRKTNPPSESERILYNSSANAYALWQNAREEQKQIDQKPFNPIFSYASHRSRHAHTTEFKELNIDIQTLIESGDKKGLYHFITSPAARGDTLQGFFACLCAYSETKSADLAVEIGFESNVIHSWTKTHTLPRRENFEKAQIWLREQFPNTDAAEKFTELYIREAFKKFENTAHFRNMPCEFWEAKVLVTNDPTYPNHSFIPSWLRETVKPVKHQGEYAKCVRRACSMRREAFNQEYGIAPHTLRIFEVENKTSQRSYDTVLQAMKHLNDDRLRIGASDLFKPEIFAELQPPASVKDPMADTPNPHITSQAHQGKITPKKYLNSELATLHAKMDLSADQKLTQIGIPDTLAEMAALNTGAIDAIINKARTYAWVEGKAEETQLRTALNTIVSTLNDKPAVR